MTIINTQEDFLRALTENPQWREAVRALILGEEMMRLPVKFDTFVETEFYPFAKRVDHFIGEQIQFNAEQRQFNEEQRQINAEQRQFNERVDHFIAEQRQINEEQRQINARTDYNIKRLTDDVGTLERLGHQRPGAPRCGPHRLRPGSALRPHRPHNGNDGSSPDRSPGRGPQRRTPKFLPSRSGNRSHR